MLLNHIFEAIKRTGKGETAVIGWGRGMGHKGHMMLASSVITKAKDVGGDPYFVVSRTVGKDDPITPEEKLEIYKKVFPQQGHIFQAASDEIPDLTRVLTNLNSQGYKNAVVVVGADQVKAFQYLKQYNGKPDKAGNVAFNFNNLEVISRQETGDPSAGEEGPRATPMRQVLMDPNATPEEQFAVWRDAMSPEVSDEEVLDLMKKAKERMAQFAAPKPKKAKDVVEAFGPLPRDNLQIRLGKYTVDIERVGKHNDHIGFAWHDSQGREHYEEVAVGDLGSYDDLIAKIKGEISYVERHLRRKQSVTETPIELDPADPMDPMIIGAGANPAKLKYRMMRASNQLKDLAARAPNADPSEWQLIARQFKELQMNIEQIEHALAELAKQRKKGGVRSRGIDPNINESLKLIPIAENYQRKISSLIEKLARK